MRTADLHNHIIPVGLTERAREDRGRHGYSIRMTSAGVEELVTPTYATQVGGEHVDPAIVEAFQRDRATPKRFDTAFRLKELNAEGIDVAIESLKPTHMSYGADESQAEWGAQAVNDAFAESEKKFPDRMYGVAHVPLQFPRLAVKELQRAVDLHGFRSVQIGSHVRKENLDLPELDPFWDAAQSLDVLVLVHPLPGAGRDRLPRYHLGNSIGTGIETSIAAASLIFGGVLERYPDLKVCLAHAGGFAPWIRGRWRHTSKVRPETKERGATGDFDDYFRKLYFDTAIFDRGALRYLIESVGADRVMLGTDYPGPMANLGQVPLIRGLPDLSDRQKDDILGGTALRLIGQTP